MKMDIKIKIAVGLLVIALVFGFVLFGGDSSQEKAPATQSSSTATDTKIIAFGDSLTAGYGLPAASAYPAQLEATLKESGYQVTVINAGVSGETTRGNLERVPFIISQKPSVVIIGIGGNDALRALPLEDTEANIKETISLFKNSEAKPTILLLQMQAPLNAGLSYKRQFDGMYERLAEENDITLVPFLTAELFLNSENKLSDGIHYNELGYQKAVQKYIAPAVEEVLEE